MTDNDFNDYANRIGNVFFSLENQNKPREVLLDAVKTTLIELYTESKKQGRNQILNHFKVEIENLKEQ